VADGTAAAVLIRMPVRAVNQPDAPVLPVPPPPVVSPLPGPAGPGPRRGLPIPAV